MQRSNAVATKTRVVPRFQQSGAVATRQLCCAITEVSLHICTTALRALNCLIIDGLPEFGQVANACFCLFLFKQTVEYKITNVTNLTISKWPS